MDGDDLTRFIFLRSLAFVYLFAFLIVVNQFRALVGVNGLLPAGNFIKHVSWKASPSLFYLHYSDRTFVIMGWLGVVLSVLALLAIPDYLGYIPFLAVWFLLWVLYLSFVNIGQVFYSFGWETMLLETGFLAIFLGPMEVETPIVVLWLIRWILFRNMFGAGLIKMRGAPCWRNLTCLYYHFETQPMPNPLSRFFHHLPKPVLRWGLMYNHFVELVVPWFYFAPHPISDIAGILTILFQVILILSGNLSFLNYLTTVQCIACFSGNWLSYVFPIALSHSRPLETGDWVLVGLLTCLISYLSINPIRNMISSRQIMNTSFDPLHLVNTYGAFGSVLTKRFEIILEGSEDGKTWLEYEFKGKPGDISKMPPIVAPYHLRLDWLMWFAAMGDYRSYPWILNFIGKLLSGDQATLELIAHKNPFNNTPPKYIRALLYRYEFTSHDDRSKNWWKRQFIRIYLSPVSLKGQ